MNEVVALRWKMSPPGSADLTVNLSQDIVKIHTTYVGDGFASVLEAAIDLQSGSSSAIAFLPAEPGGTCLFFGGAGEEVYLQIVGFADMQSVDGRWSGGGLRWHGQVTVRSFIRSVVLMADEVLVQCGGSTAYSRAWGGIPFPTRQLETLRQGL